MTWIIVKMYLHVQVHFMQTTLSLLQDKII